MGDLISGAFGSAAQVYRIEVVTQQREMAIHNIRVFDESEAKRVAIEIARSYQGAQALFICEGDPSVVCWALKGAELEKRVAVPRGWNEAV